MRRKKGEKSSSFKKVVNELFPVKENHGGGLIKIEAWEDTNGEVVKYSMVYINHRIYADDNGRVLGYDNTHEYHHKHYLGKISPVKNFTSYQELIERFENEVKEFIK